MNTEAEKNEEVSGEKPEAAEVNETPSSKEESAEAAAEAAGEEADKPAEEKKDEKPAEPDWKDHYARLLADFDNFKKRTARDREDIFRYAESDILKDFLPVVDNLSLALSTAADKEDPFVKGVQLVYDTFLNALKDHGWLVYWCSQRITKSFHYAIIDGSFNNDRHSSNIGRRKSFTFFDAALIELFV